MKILDEFEGAEFGDKRLSRRLRLVVEDVAAAPDSSFPDATADDAALEGLYRFLGNDAVTPNAILAPHFHATVRRIRAAKSEVVVPHDSSEFNFRRDEMGPLGESRVGFLGHFSLAVLHDGTKEPLGCLGFEALIRAWHDDRPPRVRRRDPDCEELRWWNAIDAIERAIGAPGKLIHVADREADSYELLAKLVANQYRFVLRMTYDRSIGECRNAIGTVSDVIYSAPLRASFQVPVTAQAAVDRGAHRKPARTERLATVTISAAKVQLARPSWTHIEGPPSLELNVVLVREQDPPAGDRPVEWRLATTEPIAGVDDLDAVVSIYRTRWVIEEYFRALKQGCSIEKRQLEGAGSILNAVSVFVPIAWQLLCLRTMARDDTKTPATRYLSRLQVRLLQSHPKIRLKESPTVRDAFLAVAKLGGHIKNNGDPGWLVLGRGMLKLLALEEGASLAGKCRVAPPVA